jgi:transposase InsO family protein
MPWKEVSLVSLRQEFVALAHTEGANIRQLCGRFGISAKTAYKWLARYRQGGPAALADRSRRPHACPAQTPPDLEQLVLQLRAEHPAWGGRKLRARLRALGHPAVPAASTITAILRRHGLLEGDRAGRPRDCRRFERPCPNDLWQMDFKGHFGLAGGGRCHPLTILDDHSRYALALVACADERTETVQRHLIAVFRRYGLPAALLTDNGPPWGGEGVHPYTPLAVWLLRLGVRVRHGRPRHPQTQGKDERFHRSLDAELLSRRTFTGLDDCQPAFDAWRQLYNHERPHEALQLAVPASRYRVSPRPYPEVLPALEYAPGDAVRKVQQGGWISYRGRDYRLPEAFVGQPVALRPQADADALAVWFAEHRLGLLDLGRGKFVLASGTARDGGPPA